MLDRGHKASGSLSDLGALPRTSPRHNGGIALIQARTALNDLQAREAAYRRAHDLYGAGDRRCGRAWDEMRRAGDAARSILAGSEEPATELVDARLLHAALSRAETAEGQLALVRSVLAQVRPTGECI